MSFHACGNNVGDSVQIPLPNWVTEIGNQNPDIFYKDAGGIPDSEYLSLAVDNEPVLNGLTPLQVLKLKLFPHTKWNTCLSTRSVRQSRLPKEHMLLSQSTLDGLKNEYDEMLLGRCTITSCSNSAKI